jgi:protein NEDD1
VRGVALKSKACGAEASLHLGGAAVAAGASASAKELQVELLKSVLQGCLQSVQSELRQDVTNLHVEVLRQFHMQQVEMATLFESLHTAIGSLQSEVQRLRSEYEAFRDSL